ncbi:hypothetical protein AV926_06430 [Myroides marinus]|uniref:Uncharacterized protein n=1 Tax=Myroides marinus TaxID=703342 RepID=A0A161SAV1_9FLAO|nr:hypothetical protein [Myroides marinus]KZE82739.1 hypothetical protein AV926_06430 [Myroides marinus]
MKRLILLTTLLLATTNYAQKINKVPLSSIESLFIDVQAHYAEVHSNQLNLYVNYGQESNSLPPSVEYLLTDDDNTALVFDSERQITTYFRKLGYDLIKTYKHERSPIKGFKFSKVKPSANKSTNQDTLTSQKQ